MRNYEKIKSKKENKLKKGKKGKKGKKVGNTKIKKIIAALRKVIEADFKTAKQKFIAEKLGALTEDVVEHWFKEFKELKSRNKIKKPEERNIDYWVKKGWNPFIEFIEELQKIPTKTELKKQPWKMSLSGAPKVAENEKWVVYRVSDHEDAEKLGTKNWCVVRQESYWDDFYAGGRESYPEQPCNFYFALSKTRSYEVLEVTSNKIVYRDPYHRIAIQVPSRGDITFWDAHDNDQEGSPEDDEGNSLGLPSIEFSTPNMCDTCHKRDCGGCCSNCENEYDDCTCCSICDGTDRENCGCCSQCENTQDECTCCPICGDSDRDSCGCCQNCEETQNRCNCCPICESTNQNTCGCCQDCEKREGRCECEEEEEVEEKEKEKEE